MYPHMQWIRVLVPPLVYSIFWFIQYSVFGLFNILDLHIFTIITSSVLFNWWFNFQISNNMYCKIYIFFLLWWKTMLESLTYLGCVYVVLVLNLRSHTCKTFSITELKNYQFYFLLDLFSFSHFSFYVCFENYWYIYV